jgi:hypothetical protein
MKLILFDVDGTLLDSQNMICAAMQRAYESHGLVCPPIPQVLSIVGLSLEEAIGKLAQGTDHPVESLAERYKQAFFDLRAGGKEPSPLYPGARETIEALKGRPDVVLGLATGLEILREDCKVMLPKWLPYQTILPPLAAVFRFQLAVNVVEIRGFTRESRTVKDEFCVYFTLCMIYQCHGSPLVYPVISSFYSAAI